MDKRGWSLLLGALALALMLAGGLTRSWWTVKQGIYTRHMGLTEAEICGPGRACHVRSYRERPAPHERSFILFGGMVYYGTIVTALFLAAALALAARKKSLRGPVSPARLAELLAFVMLVTAILFVASRPEPGISAQVQTGLGLYAYMAGAVAAVAAAHLMRRLSDQSLAR